MDIASVVENLPLVGAEEAYDATEEYGLSRSATSDDEVGLSLFKGRVDAIEHFLVLEMLVYVGNGNQVCRFFRFDGTLVASMCRLVCSLR